MFLSKHRKSSAKSCSARASTSKAELKQRRKADARAAAAAASAPDVSVQNRMGRRPGPPARIRRGLIKPAHPSASY